MQNGRRIFEPQKIGGPRREARWPTPRKKNPENFQRKEGKGKEGGKGKGIAGYVTRFHNSPVVIQVNRARSAPTC